MRVYKCKSCLSKIAVGEEIEVGQYGEHPTDVVDSNYYIKNGSCPNCGALAPNVEKIGSENQNN